MIVNLRVYDPPETWWRRLFGRKPEERKKMYTPAVIDLSEIHFAYIDHEGDINFQKKDGSTFYAIEFSEKLFNDINTAVQNNRKKTTGFVNNVYQE